MSEREEELKNRCTKIAAESAAREEKLLKENRRLLTALKYVSNELYQAYITGDIQAKDDAIRKVMLRADKEIGDEY